MDALSRETSVNDADGEVVWFWRLDAGVKLVTMQAHRAGDGDNKARSPGRARRKPLKPIAQEAPGDPAKPVVTKARVLSYFRTRGYGCGRHPAFPAPSNWGDEN
jgi:hypothetical protein